MFNYKCYGSYSFDFGGKRDTKNYLSLRSFTLRAATTLITLYIQGAILYAVIQIMKEALSFLNKVQKFEDVQTRNSFNREKRISRPEHSSSAGTKNRGLNPVHYL
jgi:hypothetical protein